MSAEDVRKDWAQPVEKRPRCSNTSCRKPCKPSESVQDGAGLTYCSTSCGTAKEDGLSQAALRDQVEERDNGQCARCPVNALVLREEIDQLKQAVEDCPTGGPMYRRVRGCYEARVAQLVHVGFDRHAIETGASLWEAAHVEARVLGGATHLSQAVSLCLSCHKADSKKLASSRAASRRPFRRDR